MPSDFGYGAAIDAGSSGSRIYLYRWPKGSDLASPLTKVEQEALFSEERTPGINNEHGIGIDMIDELVALAKAALLPLDVDLSEVPIYLGATAGMRIVDAAFEADTMAQIRSNLHESGFLFRDDWARTISGEEEGVYDWLVANYLKNDGDFPTSATTYGALDLGGASTQISFPVATLMEDQFPLRIDTMEYPLYTRSFLHYGVDQARMEYDSKFTFRTKNNPCYPTGYRDSVSDISGSSNWEECLESVAKLFDQIPLCGGQGKERCLFDGIQQPIEDDQKFIAMSAFVYAWDFLGLQIGEETDDLTALDNRAQWVCNLTHGQQIGQYKRRMWNKPTKRKTAKPHAQCFNAAFSYHLLSKGYGLPVSKTPIEIHYDINGTKVQWALGLMLVEANKLTSILKETGHQIEYDSIGTSYIYVFMVSIAVLVVLTWGFGRLKLSSLVDIEESCCLPLIDPNAVVDGSSPRKGR